jgi:predicted enzyme related to lactoylglutathione lyase
VSAVVIFSKNVKKMAEFYEAVLGLVVASNPSDDSNDIRLRDESTEVLLHSIPKNIAKTFTIETPPQARDESAIKPIFDVVSLETSLEQVLLKGGVLTRRSFDLDGLSRHDVLDPEGNVIQLRSPTK